MKCYVGYLSGEGQFGAATCKFNHYPPTKTDVEALQSEISEQYLGGKEVLIVGWNELSEEEVPDVNNNAAEIAFRIKNTDLHVGDVLEIEDSVGSCLYKVEFGLYTFAERSHMGWYLKLDSISEGYPQESIVMERPVCDIREDPAIKSIKVIV